MKNETWNLGAIKNIEFKQTNTRYIRFNLLKRC